MPVIPVLALLATLHAAGGSRQQDGDQEDQHSLELEEVLLKEPKPTFHPGLTGKMLEPLASLDPKECGEPLVSTVKLSASEKDDIINRPEHYFSTGKDQSTHFLALLTDMKSHGGFPLYPGHKLQSPSSLEELRQMLDSGETELTFEVGMDLRNCFEGIKDLDGRDICAQASLQEFAQNVQSLEPKIDTLGKGGATLVTNLPRFVLKTLEEDKMEYAIMKEVMPTIGKALKKQVREYGGCYRTALAPICAVVDVPDPDSGKGVHWMIMRQVEIDSERETTKKLRFQGDEIDILDLKGPKFANNIRDGKTFFLAESHVWHRKDAGFVKLFPQGLELGQCSSPEAAYTLELDSELLASTQMTDYSLFFKTYPPKNETKECACYNEDPKFPLVLEATSPSSDYGQMRIAVGIIDWIERKVNRLTAVVPGSTMLQPTTFRSWWMKMWPSYFHLPRRTLDMQGFMDGKTSGEVEQLQKDQTVVALQKIKWHGGAFWTSQKLWLKDQKKYCYFGQIYETYSESIASGAKYKIPSGAKGKIVSVQSCKGEANALTVVWDEVLGSDKVFQVFPEQVMQIPRVFQA